MLAHLHAATVPPPPSPHCLLHWPRDQQDCLTFQKAKRHNWNIQLTWGEKQLKPHRVIFYQDCCLCSQDRSHARSTFVGQTFFQRTLIFVVHADISPSFLLHNSAWQCFRYWSTIRTGFWQQTFALGLRMHFCVTGQEWTVPVLMHELSQCAMGIGQVWNGWILLIHQGKWFCLWKFRGRQQIGGIVGDIWGTVRCSVFCQKHAESNVTSLWEGWGCGWIVYFQPF